MQTTATFDAIYVLVQRRNALLDRRDTVRGYLRGTLTASERSAREIEYWHTVGIIDGIGQALEALREADENVASAEWIAIETRKRGAA